MKRRFPPILNQDRSDSSEAEGSLRPLVSRQSLSDRMRVRRPGTESRRGSVPRVAPTAILGMLSLWLGCTLLCSGAEPARAVNAPLALIESVEVDGEGIFLDQIVAAPAGSPLPHLHLAPAPSVGQATNLTRAQVMAWIQSRASAVGATHWTGPEHTKVTRRTRSLDETELREMLRATLQRDHVKERGDLELRLTRAWSSILIADEPLTMRVVDLPATGVGPHFILRFELWADQERLGSWQVAASARIWREILVAEAPLKRGQLLRTAAITRERRDVLSLRDVAVVGVGEDAAELELRENVMAGQPILARALRVRPVVFRGSLVDGLVFEGGMTITLKVEVMEDGLPGNVVRVRNPRTKREMLGKVKNEQTILIPM